MKKAGYLIICLVLTLLLSCAAAAAETKKSLDNFTEKRTYTQGMFGDVSAEAWYASYVGEAYKLDLMNGSGKTTFNPSGNITIAETVAIAARLNKIYNGDSSAFKQGEPWYQVYVDYAIEKEIIGACEYFNYTEKATRADFVSILARALPSEAFENINSLEDGAIPDINSSMRFCDAAYLLYNAGILSGSDKYGTFKPGTNILRSEVATIISRVAKRDRRVKVTLEDLPECPVDGTENVKSVSVSEKILYIEPGEKYQLTAYTDPWLRNPDLKWTAWTEDGDIAYSGSEFISLTKDGLLYVSKIVNPFSIVVTADNDVYDSCVVVVKEKDYEKRRNGDLKYNLYYHTVPSIENIDDSLVAFAEIEKNESNESSADVSDSEETGDVFYYNDLIELNYLLFDPTGNNSVADRYYEYLINNKFNKLMQCDIIGESKAKVNLFTEINGQILLIVEEMPLTYYDNSLKFAESYRAIKILAYDLSIVNHIKQVESLTLSASNDKLVKGDTYPLVAQVNPSNVYCPIFNEYMTNVTFTSSDPNVVCVSEPSRNDNNSICILSAIGPGTAVITAETENGITATCAIVVEDSDIEIDNDITLPDVKETEEDNKPILTSAEIYKKTAPAVFYLEVYDYYEKEWYTGSGFFINSSGLALTCQHLVENVSEIAVYTNDGNKYSAGVVWSNENVDLALIKVNGSNFPCVDLSYKSFEGGEKIYTMGYPLGMTSSISEGLVSNPSLNLYGVPFIQISAPISPGSSGGALINEKGEVMGVTVGSFEEGQNYNIATNPAWLKIYTLTQELMQKYS